MKGNAIIIVIGIIAAALFLGVFPLGQIVSLGPGLACYTVGDDIDACQLAGANEGYHLDAGTWTQVWSGSSSQSDSVKNTPVIRPIDFNVDTLQSTCRITRYARLGWDCNGVATITQQGNVVALPWDGGLVIGCTVPQIETQGATFACTSRSSWIADRDVRSGVSSEGRGRIDFTIVEKPLIPSPKPTIAPPTIPQKNILDAIIFFFRSAFNLLFGWTGVNA